MVRLEVTPTIKGHGGLGLSKENGMFSKTWETSKRKYNVIVQRDVKIPLRDGIELNVDLFRPDSDKKFPAILSLLPFALHDQSAPLRPAGVDVGPDRVILLRKVMSWGLVFPKANRSSIMRDKRLANELSG